MAEEAHVAPASAAMTDRSSASPKERLKEENYHVEQVSDGARGCCPGNADGGFARRDSGPCAVVYCKTVGVPQGCVARPGPVVVAPAPVLVAPAPVVVTPVARPVARRAVVR